MQQVGNSQYASRDDFPETIPVFPLVGALLLPNGNLPLNIFEPRYLQMVDDAMRGDKLIGMIQPSVSAGEEEIASGALSKIGCIGRITGWQETGQGQLHVNLTGICRFEVTSEVETDRMYRMVGFDLLDQDLTEMDANSTVDRKGLLEAFKNYLAANQMEADWDSIKETDNDMLVNALCMLSPFDPAEKQAFLEAPDLKTRADTLIAVSEIYLARQGGDQEPSLQ